ncbi:MAG: hypothetical protein K6G23_08170 [Lachnospiraceae bacterium]|nr:hypothetical protein [Lachnospiraceae bacterium]
MKKNVLKKLAVLGLIGAVSVSALGCGSSASDTAKTAETKADDAAAADSAESADAAESTKTEPTLDKNDPAATAATNGINLPEVEGGVLSLEVSIPEFNFTSDGTMIQEEWEKRMEAYLGVDLDITWTRTPYADYRENELLVLQAGSNIPDIATTTKGSAIVEYGEDGTLLNISDYEDYMVYYTDYLEETNGGPNYAKNEDGSMYYFIDGSYNPDDILGAQSFTAFAYRFDILQKMGWTPATTLDEFTQLCADMQAAIDDGTLDLDYVIINNTKDYSIYRGFVGIFHTWDCLYNNGTEWVYGPIEDNFRDMLRYINGLYEAGYIDPEFATADFNQGTVKATTNVGAICPTLWAGSVASWNTAKTEDTMEWGLAYLPSGDYGTAWKWGSKQGGKSLNANASGIYISGETEYPEYCVAMIDYQYSDQIVELLNWGIEGVTYNVVDGEKVYIDEIMNAENPANTSGSDYGLMASSVCRTGIPFVPIDFNAMLELASLPEPWWNESNGYYEGKYWVESSVNGGEDSVSPYDRAPVTYLTAEEQTDKSQLSYGGACETRTKELAHKFIVGELDIDDDAAWESYIEDIKSQTDNDFDTILATLNEKTVK